MKNMEVHLKDNYDAYLIRELFHFEFEDNTN